MPPAAPLPAREALGGEEGVKEGTKLVAEGMDEGVARGWVRVAAGVTEGVVEKERVGDCVGDREMVAQVECEWERVRVGDPDLVAVLDLLGRGEEEGLSVGLPLKVLRVGEGVGAREVREVVLGEAVEVGEGDALPPAAAAAVVVGKGGEGERPAVAEGRAVAVERGEALWEALGEPKGLVAVKETERECVDVED